MSLRNFSTQPRSTQRDFQDAIEAQMQRFTLHNPTIQDVGDFYSSPNAQLMGKAYMANHLEGLIHNPQHNEKYMTNIINIEKKNVELILLNLRTLRRFYNQKIVPYSTILKLEELIKRLEKELK